MAKEAASHLRARVLLNFASSKQLSCNKYKSKNYTFWPLHWKWPMPSKRLSAIWWAPKYLNSRTHKSYNQNNFCFVLFMIIDRSRNQTKPNLKGRFEEAHLQAGTTCGLSSPGNSLKMLPSKCVCCVFHDICDKNAKQLFLAFLQQKCIICWFFGFHTCTTFWLRIEDWGPRI